MDFPRHNNTIINKKLKYIMGLNDFLKKIFGNKSQRDLREIQPIVAEINKIYPTLENLSNDELRDRITKIRAALKDSVADKRKEIADIKAEIENVEYENREPYWEKIDKIEKDILEVLEDELNKYLPEVFAIVRDTARRFAQNESIEVTASDFDRELAAQGKDFIEINDGKAIYHNHWMAGGNEVTWDMIHYDVQLIGGIVLHQGKIAEMATGEGKTLVATLPVFLNALTGNGVHMVTVNDYLAKRDSEWMGPLYMFHGLSVDCIDKTEPNSPERRRAYNADITFGTNNEFGFDYLRDNMATSPADLVQRPHNFAIVDEVDSVLIDDARTPLIISGPVAKGDDQMFDQFKPNVETVVNAQRRLVTSLLTDAKKKIASDNKDERKEGALLLFRAFKGLPKYGPLIKYLSQDGIKPLLLETEAFYMQDNNKQMPIVTDPLYFVIDEKNRSIELTDKGIDVLTGKTDDPTFFILPDITTQLAELENENISDEEKAEKKSQYAQNYAIKAERVHTVNQLLKAYTLFDRDIEYVIDDGKIKIVDEQTGRIMEGRRYSDGLHQAIEAKEGVKVEAATQTFATITLQNYFRMYHKLAGMTGTAETEAGEFWDIYKLDVVTIPTNRPVARIDMNDRVYKTKKEKYNAVIDEIQKMVEAGRPVLVGTTSVEISELLSRMLQLRRIPHNVLNAKLHQKEAEIVARAGQKAVVTIATNMAGRGTDIKLTPEVKAAGGLAIIGTERHESRRVDRQLRGRAGRQGDPGSSQFFVSLEDDLMRLFGSGRIATMMDRMGLKEGEVIQAGMMTRAIERAQKKVEENNFGIRKRLLEYDDVMNSQREVIYTRRRHALYGERIEIDLNNIMYDYADNFVEENRGIEFEDFRMELIREVAVEPQIDEATYKDAKPGELVEAIVKALKEAYARRAKAVADTVRPVMERIYEDRKDQLDSNIYFPLTDGHLGYNVPVNLRKCQSSDGAEIYKVFSKVVMFTTIDDAWREHLREMDDLRQSVQNATYEQKDPLLIYKFESFGLFSKMIIKVNRDVLAILNKAYIPVRDQNAEAVQRQQQERAKVDVNKLQASRMQAAAQAGQEERQKPMPLHAEKKAGRNDPCPCGSGKKYKNCHGKGL